MVKDQDLFAVGAEYSKINYENFWDWFVQFGKLEHQWKYEPSYLLSEIVYLLGGLFTLIHAIHRGGRLRYLWLATIFHGLCIEGLSFALPEIDNYWHSQTLVTLLGGRLPLHILFLYPCFIYNASVAVAKLKLPLWSEPFTVGLLTLLMDLPYDIIGVNFIHWTWHDTDPNIYDRHYWVPWNSYYFHICFAASFTFWFHFSRRVFCKSDGKWIADKFFNEFMCTLIPGVMGTIGGIVMFVPLYHPLHDVYQIHSEVTFFIMFTLFGILAWTGYHKQKMENLKNFTHKLSFSTLFLVAHILLHYVLYTVIAIFFNPENELSVGLKEPVGPCNEKVSIKTLTGAVLQKRKYLCIDDYDEKYYDFSCVKKVPSHGSIWYTICGVPFPNQVELIAVVSTICLLGFILYTNLHFRSYGDDVFNEKSQETTKKVKRN